MEIQFEWDETKNTKNIAKHSIDFEASSQAFFDQDRLIIEDMKHSEREDRFHCIGKTKTGVVTVRFTYRGAVIRIFGAGYWRYGRKLYYEKNKIHKSS